MFCGTPAPRCLPRPASGGRTPAGERSAGGEAVRGREATRSAAQRLARCPVAIAVQRRDAAPLEERERDILAEVKTARRERGKKRKGDN